MGKYFVPFTRFCGAESRGPGPPVGVLLAGGADDRSDVEVGGPSWETDVLPRPEPEQVPPPSTHRNVSLPLGLLTQLKLVNVSCVSHSSTVSLIGRFVEISAESCLHLCTHLATIRDICWCPAPSDGNKVFRVISACIISVSYHCFVAEEVGLHTTHAKTTDRLTIVTPLIAALIGLNLRCKSLREPRPKHLHFPHPLRQKKSSGTFRIWTQTWLV